jgi:hypothetical protein
MASGAIHKSSSLLLPIMPLRHCALVPLCLCAFVPLCVNDVTYKNSYVIEYSLNSFTFVLLNNFYYQKNHYE